MAKRRGFDPKGKKTSAKRVKSGLAKGAKANRRIDKNRTPQQRAGVTKRQVNAIRRAMKTKGGAANAKTSKAGRAAAKRAGGFVVSSSSSSGG